MASEAHVLKQAPALESPWLSSIAVCCTHTHLCAACCLHHGAHAGQVAAGEDVLTDEVAAAAV